MSWVARGAGWRELANEPVSTNGTPAASRARTTRARNVAAAHGVYEALARQAREEHWGYEEYLHEVDSAEQTSRRDSAVRQRLREARFPEMKTHCERHANCGPTSFFPALGFNQIELPFAPH